MRIYDKENKKIQAYKVRRPRFSHKFGRTWQWGTMTVDNIQHQYTYDNTWGAWWYFHWNSQWNKVNIWKQYEPHWNMKFTSQELKPQTIIKP